MNATDTIDAPQKQKEWKPKTYRRYNVVLWNDDDHSFEYVIAMLLELFGQPPEKGFQLAQGVHENGRTIVLTTSYEHAELKRDQIHAYGADRSIKACQGSMSATVEHAD